MLARVLACLLAAFLIGVDTGPAWAGDPYRVMKILALQEKGDSLNALKLMWKELADPLDPDDREYLIDLRSLSISLLLGLVEDKRPDPEELRELDQEAMQYYHQALALAETDQGRRAQAQGILINYYSKTDRNGLALPYMKENLTHWKKTGNTYMVINLLDGFASAYHDMGQLELSARYRDRSLDLAKTYFVFGKKPEDDHQWRQYKRMLFKAMDSLAGPGNADAVLGLWRIAEPIVQKYISPQSTSYMTMAEYMALCNDAVRAEAFLGQGRERMKVEKQPGLEESLICSSGAVDLQLGNGEAAAEKLEKCLAVWNRTGSDAGISTYRNAGLAFEHIGRYDKAIEYFRQSTQRAESLRSSYSVSNRATFFRNSVRRAYWGLIRSLVKKYAAGGRPGDFFQALEASEQVRGRQFGDLMDAGDRLTPAMLAGLRKELAADQIVLAYMMTDIEIILFAFSKDFQEARVLAGDGAAFRARVLSVSKGLADPRSDFETLHSGLSAISRRVLDPVRERVAAKKRVLVLTDGMLNLVPFDLLTLDPPPDAAGPYHPLIETHTVQAVPSLRFLVHVKGRKRARPAHGLLAVADPVYMASVKVGGMDQAELAGVTRGNRFMAYFAPLPETRSEVAAIASMFTGEPVTTLYGTEAAESRVKGADLGSYRYLHFATHGILGSDLPGLAEPALVLADEPGQDCFLTASEAQALELNADLAVLSACNTGSGKYLTGEGVMGMSRAFLLAGSRSVLVSLWPVPSAETERLMISFYRHLKSGMKIADAIRRAKLEMIHSPASGGGTSGRDRKNFRNVAAEKGRLHPFFWSAFIPLGA